MRPSTLTLHPGDVACVGRGDRLETLLGSCVAILLTDPARTVGAMCHVVHAGAPTSALTRETAFGDAALQALGNLLRQRGMAPARCLAWVYGGGHMFPSLKRDRALQNDVGANNFRWALDALRHAGIPLLGVDVGGHVYRKVGWTVGHGAPEVEATPIAETAAAAGSLA